MKWRLLSLRGLKRKPARDEQPDQPSTLHQQATDYSNYSKAPSGPRRARPAPLSPLSLRHSAFDLANTPEDESEAGSEEYRKRGRCVEGSRREGQGVWERSGITSAQGRVEVLATAGTVSFGQALDRQEIYGPNTYDSMLRPASTSPSSESESGHSSSFSHSTPPSSLYPSPTVTRSSTLKTRSSSFHGRRSSSSSRSHLSVSPPSSPTSSISPSLCKFNTRLDEDGRRVLARRRSMSPDPEKLRRVRGSFGVGFGEEGSSEEETPRAGLSRSRSSTRTRLACSYEGDDESTELATSLDRSASIRRPPSRRASAPVYQHTRRRSGPLAFTSLSSSFLPSTPSTSSPPSTPSTPRSVILIPLVSYQRPRPESIVSSTTLQPRETFDYREEARSATPRPSSLHRRSTVAFAEPPPPRSPQLSPRKSSRRSSLSNEWTIVTLGRRASMSARFSLARSGPPLPKLGSTTPSSSQAEVKGQRRETMSVEPRYLRVKEGKQDTRSSLDELSQLEREAGPEWWSFTSARDLTKGQLKVVNPDQGDSSSSSSTSSFAEIINSRRSSYHSCSSSHTDSALVALFNA